MPPLHPFAGIRYRAGLDLGAVTAPPYDVVDGEQRAALVARSDRNAVLLDLPLESDGAERYAAAAATFAAWRADGTLVTDAGPTLTIYRMSFVDDRGRPARTLGVIGALALSPPDEGQILPHEHTTRKARSDRLDLLRATCADLSPIWVLSLARGLTDLLEPTGPPDAEWTDDEGVDHAVWCVDHPARLAAIAAAVGPRPVVIADGHHRYATALAHRDEHRAAAGPGVELASDRLMALVVELSPRELTVRPIHRLVDGIDAEALAAVLARDAFEVIGPPVTPSEVASGEVLGLMGDAGAVALVGSDGGATLLRPRAEAFAHLADDLDSARVAAALDGVDGATLRVQHDIEPVLRAVREGTAGAGLLLRPATVAQIEANAHAGRRMPAKTTFFHPKPRTGVVFRAC